MKCRCAPVLGEDKWAKITKFEHLRHNWPDHFEAALRDLNDRILPALQFMPRELLTGWVVNTIPTAAEEAMRPITVEDAEKQLVYTQQQQLNAYSHVVEHAEEHEAVFNKDITGSRLKNIVIF